MLNLKIRNPNVFPGRPPRLNVAHPFFSQKNTVCAAVAQGKGMFDLVTQTFAAGSATLSNQDENGPYVYTTDASGSSLSQCAFPAPATTFNWQIWGGIFKVVGVTGRGYVLGINNTTGVALINNSISFYAGGGSWASFTGIAGHTYLAFTSNSVGTANLSKTAVLVDLTSGNIFTFRVASTGGFSINPVFAFAPFTTFVGGARVYALMAGGSQIPIPPAAQPAPTFYSQDQINAAIMDPWGLWYG